MTFYNILSKWPFTSCDSYCRQFQFVWEPKKWRVLSFYFQSLYPSRCSCFMIQYVESVCQIAKQIFNIKSFICLKLLCSWWFILFQFYVVQDRFGLSEIVANVRSRKNASFTIANQVDSTNSFIWSTVDRPLWTSPLFDNDWIGSWIPQKDQVYRYNMIDLISFSFCWLPNYIVDISQPFVSQAKLESAESKHLLFEKMHLSLHEVDIRENNYVLAYLYSKNFSCHLFHNVTILLFFLFWNFNKTVWRPELEKTIVLAIFKRYRQENVGRLGSSIQQSFQSNLLQ